MVRHHNRRVTDEQRREFLRALGVGGAVAAGGATIDDVRSALDAEQSAELSSVGEAIRNDVAGGLDPDLLAGAQAEVAEAAAGLPAVPDRGLPTDATEPREEFGAVAEAARPAYDHLAEAGFFESTTERLPEFTPGYVEDSVRRFVAAEAVAGLGALEFSKAERVDLLATVVTHRERIGDRHWVSTDKLERQDVAIAEQTPPMTKAAAGGVLLWLDDLDHHLWQKTILLTDEILADATWDARAMAAGFHVMADGARRVAEPEGSLSDDELAGLLSGGFALQAIAQNLLREDAYWITEEMRADRSHEDITLSGGE